MEIIPKSAKDVYDKQKIKNLCDNLSKIMEHHILEEAYKTALYGDNYKK